MAFSVADGRVVQTAGRGKNKTVVLDVSFKELERWARRMKIDAPKLMRKSFGRACRALRAKMQKVVSNAGGVEGVPKFKDFDEFTQTLRAKTGRTAPMGGVLAGKKVIVAYRRGDTQYIGWPDNLAKWSINFQDAVGGPAFSSNSQRHYWHRLGIKYIPREYAHNPRRVLPEPFGGYVRKNLDEWAQHNYYKELARQMQKSAAAISAASGVK